MTKEQYKNKIKTTIKNTVSERVKELKEKSKKLRFINVNQKREPYIEECRISEAREIIKLRLNMLKKDNNYGKKTLCEGCKEEEETTGHLIKCTVKEIRG